MKRKLLTFLLVVGAFPVAFLILLAISSESKLNSGSIVSEFDPGFQAKHESCPFENIKISKI